METNFLTRPIKWFWAMRKLNTPLSVSSYLIGSKLGAKAFGFPQHLTATWYDYGDIYFDEEEVEQLRQFVRYKIQLDSSYPSNIAKKIFTLAQTIERQPLPNANELNGSLSKLVALFQHQQKTFLRMIGFMSYRGTIQVSDVLGERVKTALSYRLAQQGKLGKLEEFLEKVSVPLHQSVIAKEKEFILRQAIGFTKLTNKNQSARIQAYLNQYSWLAYHWFVGKPPTEVDVRARLLQLEPSAAVELKKLHQLSKQNEQTVQQTIKKLRLNSTEKNLLKQYREWIFLRTFVKDSINLAGYKLLPVLAAIARKLGILIEDIVQLTLEEITNIQTIPVQQIKEKIEQRRHGFSAGIVKSVLEFGSFVKQTTTPRSPVSDEFVIKGQIACRGIIRGIVRVVLFPKNKLNLIEVKYSSLQRQHLISCRLWSVRQRL